METISLDGAADTRTVTEQFLALIYSDETLLRAEFDAIIAAAWPGPPTVTPQGRATDRPHRGAHPETGVRVARSPGPRRPGIGGWARQRAPPCSRNATGASNRPHNRPHSAIDGHRIGKGRYTPRIPPGPTHHVRAWRTSFPPWSRPARPGPRPSPSAYPATRTHRRSGPAPPRPASGSRSGGAKTTERRSYR